MIAFCSNISQVNARLADFIGKVGPAGRHNLFSVAALAVSSLVRSHLSREAARRHFSAARLGARPTGHLSRAAARVSFSADSDHGEVVIPGAGISRAFHDLNIRPRRAAALTIPLSAHAYGHTSRELKSLGWTIFRPKGSDVLMGKNDGAPVALYALKKSVHQPQDRSLLPSDAEIGQTAATAILTELRRHHR